MPRKQPPTRENVPNVITYLRISLDKRALAAGVERQRTDTRALCAREGWPIIREFVDNDRSASRRAKKVREEWAELMTMLRTGNIDVVVAYNLDRLTRMPRELEDLIDCAEHGLKIVTVQGIIDLSTSQGRTEARIMMAFAANEADRIAERTKRECQAKAEAGGISWVVRPFGYTTDGNVIAKEAKILRRAADQIIDGGLSMHAVCKELNDKNILTSCGTYWTTGSLSQTLKSVRNIAKREYEGELYDAVWKPIFTQERHDQLLLALRLNARGPQNRRTERQWLSGILECETCRAAGNGRYKLTRVSNAQKSGPPLIQYRCAAKSIGGCGMTAHAASVERIISEAIIKRAANMQVRARTDAERTNTRTAEMINEEIDAVNEMHDAGTLKFPEWRKHRDRLAAELSAVEIAAIEEAGAAVIAELVTLPGGLDANWATLPEEAKRRLAKWAIARVTVKPAAQKGGRFNIDRLAVDFAI